MSEVKELLLTKMEKKKIPRFFKQTNLIPCKLTKLSELVGTFSYTRLSDQRLTEICILFFHCSKEGDVEI